MTIDVPCHWMSVSRNRVEHLLLHVVCNLIWDERTCWHDERGSSRWQFRGADVPETHRFHLSKGVEAPFLFEERTLNPHFFFLEEVLEHCRCQRRAA